MNRRDFLKGLVAVSLLGVPTVEETTHERGWMSLDGPKGEVTIQYVDKHGNVLDRSEKIMRDIEEQYA